MDNETREYLERKLFVLATKDDVEKLRQETKSNFRQVKEGDKTNLLEWAQGIKKEIDELRKEHGMAIDPILGMIREGLQDSREEARSMLDRWNKIMESTLQGINQEITVVPDRIGGIMESSLRQMRDDTQAAVDQSTRDMRSYIEVIKEEETVSIAHLMQETKTDMGQLKEGIERVGRQVEQMAADAGTLKDKIREDITQAKEELGSMIKFSYADLEKKIAALEARIKALEKMTFH